MEEIKKRVQALITSIDCTVEEIEKFLELWNMVVKERSESDEDTGYAREAVR